MFLITELLYNKSGLKNLQKSQRVPHPKERKYRKAIAKRAHKSESGGCKGGVVIISLAVA